MISAAKQMALKRDGLLVLDGIPASTATDCMYSLAAELGRPYLYYPQIMDIRPKYGSPPASSGGAGRFLPHTDHAWFANPPRFVIMYCVNEGEPGSGVPTIADVSTAVAALSCQDVQHLRSLPIWFPPPDGLTCTGYVGPILDQLLARVHPAAIAGHAGAPARFYQAILDAERPIEVERSTLWVIDNFRLCHGRTEIHAGFKTSRHFLRLYAEGIKLGDPMAAFNSYDLLPT
jgi:hypothetical protein